MENIDFSKLTSSQLFQVHLLANSFYGNISTHGSIEIREKIIKKIFDEIERRKNLNY